VGQGKVWSGAVPATVVAVLLLVSTSCTAVTSSQSSSPTAGGAALAATPAESPAPYASPSPSSVATPLAKLIITSLRFHVGEVGITYAPVVLGATGGKPPYRWTANSATLPTGLALSSDGKLSGTPAVAGTYSFVVRVDDSAGDAARAGRSITVARRLAVIGSCATRACSVEQGCTSVCGAFGSQTGGVGPFKYATTTGSLPPSMSLNALSLAGTFTTVSKYFFAVTVTDSVGAVGSIGASFNVFPHIAFTASSATCSGPVPSGCTTQLRYTGGKPSGAPTVKVTDTAKPALPKGSTFTAAKGVVDVAIAGSLCSSVYGKGYDAVVTLVLVDQSPCGVAFNCSSGKLSLAIHLVTC
jgi:hypothetical protein